MPSNDPEYAREYAKKNRAKINAKRRESYVPSVKAYKPPRKFKVGERIYVPMELSNATIVVIGSYTLDVDIEYDGILLTIPTRWAVKKDEPNYKEV